ANGATVAGAATAAVPPAAVAAGQSFVSAQPVALRPYFEQLLRAGERNAVLNFNRLGVAAMANHEYDIAKKAFDQSIQRIDAFRTGGADLKAAKSKFQQEASKDFKGEPYERAMVFYYRGLLYLADGDFSNAGASFARANVEDSQAEGEQYQADYASMKFLNAWALQCQGEASRATDLVGQASALRGDLASLDHLQPNLLVVEAGDGPRKTGSGKYNENLAFEDGGAGAAPTIALTDGARPSPVLAEELYFQASTRGGRPVEYILAGKAKFKDAAGTAADVSSAVAMGALGAAGISSANGNYGAAATASYISAASTLFSLVSSAVEASTTPAADTRSWESLPGSLWLATPQGSDLTLVEGATVNAVGAERHADLVGKNDRCALGWFRTTPVPPPQADAVEKIDGTAEAQARLRQFQAALPSWF
ncbi:MAG: hypothetical protein K2Y51_20080, partial [Gammaproteobacteria bacterium]|nr:hypothetical protein [Gammaproteobacteria bacterium]